MGRVRVNLKINGVDCWTLFDSGAERTYVVEAIGGELNPGALRRPFPARLGGEVHSITKYCELEATIEGKYVNVRAFIVDALGMDRKARRPFRVLFGALAMQEWGIELDLKGEQLDLSAYPEEWVEF